MKLLLIGLLFSVVLISSFAKNVVKREFESLDELTNRLEQLTEQVDQDTALREYSGTCDARYKKVGCFRDKGSAKTLEHLLLQDRDKFGKHYGGKLIDWHHWEDYMKDLACRCAKLARSKGYVHFGLQYYGECYGGHESTRRYDHYGRSSKCTGQNYQPCNDDSSTECVGKGFTNYVYHVDQEGSGGGEINPNYAYDN